MLECLKRVCQIITITNYLTLTDINVSFCSLKFKFLAQLSLKSPVFWNIKYVCVSSLDGSISIKCSSPWQQFPCVFCYCKQCSNDPHFNTMHIHLPWMTHRQRLGRSGWRWRWREKMEGWRNRGGAQTKTFTGAYAHTHTRDPLPGLRVE